MKSKKENEMTLYPHISESPHFVYLPRVKLYVNINTSDFYSHGWLFNDDEVAVRQATPKQYQEAIKRKQAATLKFEWRGKETICPLSTEQG